MGNIVAGGIGPAGARLEGLFHAGHAACDYLRAIDHRDHAAERGSGGPGGRIRRGRQPDGVWTAGRGDVSFQGYDLVRDHVHVDFHGADHASEFNSRVHRQLGVAAIFQDVEVSARDASGSCFNAAGSSACCSSGPCSGSACSTVEISSGGEWIQAADFLAAHNKVVSTHLVRKWRNWQTHHLEGVAP